MKITCTILLLPLLVLAAKTGSAEPCGPSPEKSGSACSISDGKPYDQIVELETPVRFKVAPIVWTAVPTTDRSGRTLLRVGIVVLILLLILGPMLALWLQHRNQHRNRRR